MLETGNPAVRFKPRLIEGLTLPNPPEPERLILDGQQRLTTLFQALLMDEPVTTRDANNKEIRRWYYVNLGVALDPMGDREDAIVGIPADRIVRNFRNEVMLDLSTEERECTEEMLPARLLFDVSGLMNWQMLYVQREPEHVQSRLDRWKQVLEQIIQPFQQYQVPLILLRKSTPKEAVCKVFEKVNTGGVALSVFELVTATYAADNYSLRDDWRDRQSRLRKYKVLRGVENTDFLQAVTLLASMNRKRTNPDAAVSCKRRDILQLDLEDYKTWAEPATKGFERAAKLLYQQNIFDARDVPYRTQLVPLAAILADLSEEADKDGVRSKLNRWYWCGVLGELYGGAIETRFAKDLPQVVDWVRGGSEPDTIADATFVPLRLRTLRTRNSAAYKGIHALLMRDGAQDFRTGDTVDAQQYFEDRIDVHHIFPVDWCSKHEITSRLPDSIVNKTPLAAKTNRMIGGSAPSLYLQRIQRAAGITEDRLDEILRSHVIDSKALRKDDFEAFFRAREAALLDRIEEATGKPIAQARAGGPSDLPEANLLLEEADEQILIPEGAKGVVVVEGTTDEEYLRLAARAGRRSSLLDGLHIVPAGGVNKAVLQALLIKNQTDKPVLVLLDKDQNGKAARETLKGRFEFSGKREVMTYADVLEGNPDDIEAEDLFPGELFEAFLAEYGEDNVLSEKRQHKGLGRWHYGFNGRGKDMIGEYLRDRVTESDVDNWIRVLESIRARLGLPTQEVVDPPPPVTAEPLVPLDLEDEEPPYDLEEDYEEDAAIDKDVDKPSPRIDQLFYDLREGILALGPDIREVQRQRYTAFEARDRFLVVRRRRHFLILRIGLKHPFDDPLGLVDVSREPTGRVGDMWFHTARVVPGTDLQHVLSIVRQAYEARR
jgi:predicted transport protein/5S rRNA maturation endonuclease (ribonuclease M5)